MKQLNTFIQKAIQKYGNKYEYSKVVYKDINTPVVITCSSHGEFSQTPRMHLKSGCRQCLAGSGPVPHSTTSFINKANIIHNNFYTYKFVEYTNSTTKVTITCPLHGNFKQAPSEHLAGSKCRDCGYLFRREKKPDSLQVFIAKAKLVHGTKYDYSKTIYINNATKVVITCPIHGDFTQVAGTHSRKRGSGCPKCVESTGVHQPKVYRGKKTILYYIKIKGYYKIGLTRISVARRYRKDVKLGMKYEIVKQWEFTNGEVAALIEKECLKQTNKYQLLSFQNRDIIPTKHGSSELRNKDIIDIIERNLHGNYIQL